MEGEIAELKKKIDIQKQNTRRVENEGRLQLRERDDQIADLKQQLDEASKNRPTQQASRQVSTLKQQVDDLKTQNKLLQTKLERAETENASLKASMSGEAVDDVSTDDATALIAVLQAQKQADAERLRAAYEKVAQNNLDTDHLIDEARCVQDEAAAPQVQTDGIDDMAPTAQTTARMSMAERILSLRSNPHQSRVNRWDQQVHPILPLNHAAGGTAVAPRPATATSPRRESLSTVYGRGFLDSRSLANNATRGRPSSAGYTHRR